MRGKRNCRPTVSAAERKPVGKRKDDKKERRYDTGRGIGRQHADARRGDADQRDRDEEGVFAAQPVTQRAEKDRAQRPHAKARAERGEREQKGGSLVLRGEEQLADKHRKRAVDEKIVPFENSAQR